MKRFIRMIFIIAFISTAVLFPPACMAQTDQPKHSSVPLYSMAPIANPYFVLLFGAASPSTGGFDRQLRFNTQTIETLSVDDAYWIGRGVWPSGWYYGTQGVDFLDSVEAYVKYMEEAINKGTSCICFDEWVGTDSAKDIKAFFDANDWPISVKQHAEEFWKGIEGNKYNAMLAKACSIIKQRHPEVFLIAYTHMQSQSLQEALRRGWVDLAVIEAYQFIPNEPVWTPELAHWRAGLAAKAGVLENTIPAISVYQGTDKQNGRFTTTEMIEKEIKFYRKHYPQMPGIGFYCHYVSLRENDPAHRALIRTCDRLVKKYYIDPAPRVTITAPIDGKVSKLPLKITARANKKIAKWRLYIGGVLTAEQVYPDFIVKSVPIGPVVITVQAITADYLRGVVQVEAEVTE